MSFSTNLITLLYEIFYCSYLWHSITHFGTIFFMRPYYKAETKFCASICKSVFVHTRSQTKRPTASKFGTEILERIFEKDLKTDCFKNWSRFFRMIFKYIFLDFSENNSFISWFYTFLRDTRGLKLLNLVHIC